MFLIFSKFSLYLNFCHIAIDNIGYFIQRTYILCFCTLFREPLVSRMIDEDILINKGCMLSAN